MPLVSLREVNKQGSKYNSSVAAVLPQTRPTKTISHRSFPHLYLIRIRFYSTSHPIKTMLFLSDQIKYKLAYFIPSHNINPESLFSGCILTLNDVMERFHLLLVFMPPIPYRFPQPFYLLTAYKGVVHRFNHLATSWT